MLRRPGLVLALATMAGLALTTPALGFWTGEPGGAPRGTGAAAAASVDQASAPAVSLEGNSNVLVDWSPSTMSDGSGVDRYLVKRYDADTDAPQTILSSCAVTIPATSCTEASVPAGDWRYSVTPTVGDNWRGAESARSAAIAVPGPQPPTQTFALEGATGASISGTTLYYKGNSPGGFQLIDTVVVDPAREPASASFPSIATTGWIHDAETVTTPAGGPYVSATFGWTADPANPTSYAVTAADDGANVDSAPITFVSDTTSPTGGSISYPDGVITHLSVPVTLTNGTDSQSGIAAGSRVIKRAEAILDTTTQTCGVFGAFSTSVTLVGGADTSVVSGRCYMYVGQISDNVGNQATYVSANVVKVHTSGPPVLFGRADPFAVLAATTVTNAGATVITGDLGISPGTACTGLPTPCTGNGPGTVNGSIHSADSTALGAQVDYAAAYNDAGGRTVTGTLLNPELGGTTRFPGVYDSATGVFTIGSTLTLDGNGDPDSVFIFKTATMMNMVAGGNVVLINGAQSCNVFWRVGTSSALAANTVLRGNLLALTITVAAGAVVDGRLLARDAAVTLSTNIVTRPTCL